MRNRISQGLVIFTLIAIAYIAGRSRSRPVAPLLPAEVDLQAFNLDAPRLNIDLRDQTRTQIVDWLAKAYGARIEVESGPLEAAGIRMDEKVSLQIAQANLHEALRLFGSESGMQTFGYLIRGDAIVVTTMERAMAGRVTRVYSLAPIYRARYGRDLPKGDIEIALPPGDLFGRTTSPLDPSNPYPDFDEFAILIAELVQSQVEPESWRENGGMMGSARLFLGVLIVEHEPHVQAKVARYLNTLVERGMVMPTTKPGSETTK